MRGERRARVERQGGERQLVHGAGRRARAGGIDDDHLVGAVEQGQQVGAAAVDGVHLGAGRRLGAEPARHFEADAVVACRAADADDADHRRSISRRRKWVAQEMQGS